MALSETDVIRASERGARRQANSPRVMRVRFDRRSGRVVLSLSSGLDVSFLPRQVQEIAAGTAVTLTDAVISPSGLGIHFPSLDADVYVPALLEGFLGTRRWNAQMIGALGGKSTTGAKARAARENGKRGGRPRKDSRVA